MKTLDELMTEYEPERLAEIARDDTPAARMRTALKRQTETAKEIRQGLRDPDGEWIETEPDEDEDEDDEHD